MVNIADCSGLTDLLLDYMAHELFSIDTENWFHVKVDLWVDLTGGYDAAESVFRKRALVILKYSQSLDLEVHEPQLNSRVTL
jgi:hypothetical protein